MRTRDENFSNYLHRDVINLSIEAVANYLEGEIILVTGGGGTIGSEICRQVAQHHPRSLMIFDNYENNAYDIQMELLQKYKENLEVKVIIGSIQDENRLNYVFSKFKPTIIFHAAAHKHVPLMEDNPQEAFKNNVLGTLHLAECANLNGCKKFVLISTDKALCPSSVMGATKRIAELLMQYMQSISQTAFATVRFGNVLGSNGSVIPLFAKQLENGGPITVTHPEVSRYFMTISEATSLVLQAGALMKGGEIFVLDMGEPIKIIDIAKELITKGGYVLDQDVTIKYIGLRPGEKLEEEILISKEKVDPTEIDKIFIEKTATPCKENFITMIKECQMESMEDTQEILRFINKLLT